MRTAKPGVVPVFICSCRIKNVTEFSSWPPHTHSRIRWTVSGYVRQLAACGYPAVPLPPLSPLQLCQQHVWKKNKNGSWVVFQSKQMGCAQLPSVVTDSLVYFAPPPRCCLSSGLPTMMCPCLFCVSAGGQQRRSHGGGGLGGVWLPPAAQRSAQQEGRLLHRYETIPCCRFSVFERHFKVAGR